MITLGIKAGPQRASFADLDATRPAMAEIWFNINKKNEYDNLFSYWALVEPQYDHVKNYFLAKKLIEQV